MNDMAGYLIGHQVASCDSDLPEDILKSPVISQGRMTDVCAEYRVFMANGEYVVQIGGNGKLAFNLRDFDMQTCTDTPFHVIVSESYDTIASRAFFDWYSLSSLCLPRSVKKIEREAFSDCDMLRVILMPGDLWDFSEEMFCYTEPEEIVFYPDRGINPRLVDFFASKHIAMTYRGRRL